MTRARTGYVRWGKRTLDVLVAGAGLVVAAPVMLAVAAAIRVTMGSPVAFRQPRPGHRERPFTMLKFRTMDERRADDGTLLPDDARLTPLGRWLRRTSLDELPELWNVLRGDMSLVGPRPLLMHYLAHYDARQRRRHDVRPGITGLAQVSGRNGQTWAERFEHDLHYVDHVSLALDLRILWRTLVVVVSGRGIAAPGHATMPELAEKPKETRAS